MFITYLKLFLNNLGLNKSRLSNEITREKDSCRETHGDRRENEKKKKNEEEKDKRKEVFTKPHLNTKTL